MSHPLLAFFDSPQVLDASVTPIPGNGSPPLQVIASLPDMVQMISVRDGIESDFIGIYSGLAGSEILEAVIGSNGDPTQRVFFRINARISLRAMGPAPISLGQLCINFLTGYLR